MERADITKHVLEYAHNRLAPFTAADAFENIDAIETAKQVSDSLGRLYNQRILARRRIDRVRYAYIRAEIRPVGFEMAPEQPTAELKAPDTPEKTAEQTTLNVQFMQTEAEQKQDTKPEQQPDWLKTAHEIVHGDREKNYGDPGKNLRLIAQYWSTHTGITITETDVCIMMMLLKIARLKNNPEHQDSWIDTAGYVALKNKLDNACKPKANS